MTISRELFLSILAMDSYNRGYGAGVAGLSNAVGTLIGTAHIARRTEDGDILAQQAGFYGIAYDWNGETVISFRGTDNFSANPTQGGSDVLNGWVAALGTQTSQVDEALSFYAAVTGQSVFAGAAANVVLTGHSLGGGVALQYAGTFPEKVERLVTIEGLGGLGWRDTAPRPAHVRMRRWMESMRELEARAPRVYPTLEAAIARMVERNSHLTPAFARHLAIEGVREVEGGYAWKFDNFTRAGSPYEFNMEDARDLWNQVRCPILILYGDESWGRRFPDGLDFSPFHDYRVECVADAGHWVHHDQFEVTMAHINTFLGAGR